MRRSIFLVLLLLSHFAEASAYMEIGSWFDAATSKMPDLEDFAYTLHGTLVSATVPEKEFKSLLHTILKDDKRFTLVGWLEGPPNVPPLNPGASNAVDKTPLYEDRTPLVQDSKNRYVYFQHRALGRFASMTAYFRTAFVGSKKYLVMRRFGSKMEIERGRWELR